MNSNRVLPRHTMIRPNAGTEAPRTVTSDDYPLVEIIPEPALGGHWLVLHTAPDVPAEGASMRFIVEGEALVLIASRMLESYYIRTTLPATSAANRHPVTVYTATDHLAR